MMVFYKYLTIEGLKIFFREAGSPHHPAIVLLHGFPSSSHMFRDLIPLLADCFHVIAPDYPGFGNSSMPTTEEYEYTFDNLSLVIEKLLTALRVSQYILYVHDYGGPIGFRLAVRNPKRILGFVIQNAVAHEQGLGEPFALFKALWANPNPATKAAFARLTTFDFTKKQYLTGACNPYLISPDGYSLDQFFLDRPGNSQIQLQLGYDYRQNVAAYPAWQHYLRTWQPPTLVAWGKNDFIFTLAGAQAFSQELISIETCFLCGGHFVLEEQSLPVSLLIKSFFGRIYSWPALK
ncbi:alpha/beta hydrolase [Desulfosporosinus sp. PR]|uniref:alpha/beta fold hydrolase n=1 Tax=Candidatus Desulfosporosinus nitrosoreducens TaxID=3401928 RepID=UPI0027FCC924|nr:alpha/beta hydrolase [Desulfosporosinus sp. PR]MDQ7095741.1 alpha/beta hydrolase [Desulfosporosinus sp. PR]